MSIGFRFLLVTADNEPVEPDVVTFTEQRWDVGDVVVLGRNRRYRILDVQPPTIEGKEAELTAYWTVEPV